MRKILATSAPFCGRRKTQPAPMTRNSNSQFPNKSQIQISSFKLHAGIGHGEPVGRELRLCPSCKGTMKVTGTMIRRDEVEFFLRLHGLWEGLIALPPPFTPLEIFDFYWGPPTGGRGKNLPGKRPNSRSMRRESWSSTRMTPFPRTNGRRR